MPPLWSRSGDDHETLSWAFFFQVRVKFQLTSGSLPYTVLRLIQRLASLNSVTDTSEKTSHGYVINRLILVFPFHPFLLQKQRNKQRRRRKQQITEMPQNRKNVATGESKRVSIT